MTIIFLIFTAIITYLTIPYIMNMLIEGKLLSKNYRGETIPIAMGITFVPVMLLNLFIFLLLYKRESTILITYILAINIMALVGIIDDLIGNKETSGFKGHFYSFLKGKLTTGFLKAFIGGIISLIISYIYSNSTAELIINTVTVALFTNFINLLDLRPGRAIKSYLFFGLLFWIIGITHIYKVILLSSIGYCIGYLPQDLKAKSMMGDVGSNSLGMSLGIICIANFSIMIKYILLIFLLFIHLLSEKYSLSKIISKNPILNFIDQLGRHLKIYGGMKYDD